MGTYAVGDIHGCFSEWLELKNRIESIDNEAKFILIGDIVDRGREQIEMLNWAMKNITRDGKYQMIMGNHEDEKIDYYGKTLESSKLRLGNDYNSLQVSELYPDRYQFTTAFIKEGLDIKYFETVIKWFKTLPYYKDIVVNNTRFILVHANLPYSVIEDKEPYKIKTKISNRDKDFILWDRDIDGFYKIPDTYLVHGHTPTVMDEAFPFGRMKLEDSGKIVKTEHRFNIDCGLVYRAYYKNCNLAALRLDDFKEFYLYE